MRYKKLMLWCALVAPAVAHAEEGLDFRGRIMLDNTTFSGVHNEGERGSEWEVRRARFGMTHKSNNDWRFKMEFDIDHDDGEVSLTDGYVQYRGWDFAKLTVGRMKESFGLENSTSSLDISTMERSVVTEAFKPGRSYGAELANGSDKHSMAVGLFRASEDDKGFDGYALTGRFTYSPINTGTNVLHLGVSGSVRDMQETNYRINEPLEVNPADTIIKSREITADRVDKMSLEGAIVYNQLSLQGEWMANNIKEVSGAGRGGKVELSGHYFLASYFLTGESRLYNNGSFDGVKPSGPGGAWEFVARYSLIDLIDNNLGAWAETFLVGINYYASDHFRLMFNISWMDVVSSDPDEDGRGNSAGFRAQYSF